MSSDPSSLPVPRPASSVDAETLQNASVDVPEVPPLSADDIEALPPPYQESIRQLHRTVEAAIATIEALRAENEQLSERIEALERRPDVPDDATVLTFDDPPEALREQIQDFLTIIDQYLGTGDGHAEEPWSPHMLSPSSPHTDAS